MDSGGPSVFRVEKTYDIRPGYQPAEAVLSVVDNATTNTNSTEEAGAEAKEAITESQYPLEIDAAPLSKTLSSPDKSYDPGSLPSSQTKGSTPRSSVCSVGNEQCHKKSEEECNDKNADQPQCTAKAITPPPSYEEVIDEGRDKTVEESQEEIKALLDSPHPKVRQNDEMVFKLDTLKEHLEGIYDEKGYPMCARYMLDKRRGAINMVLDTMHNIEAYILRGYVKDKHDKARLQEMLYKARLIIGPNRKESLNLCEARQLIELLDVAKAYVISGCKTDCTIIHCPTKNQA